MFWKKTGSAAAEGLDEPESGLTELQAEPDVSPESTAHSRNDAISSQRSVAIRNTDTRMTQGISKTGTMPTPIVIHAPPRMDFLKESAVPSQQQVSSLPGLCVPSNHSQHSVAGRKALLGGSWGSCSLGQHCKSSPCFLQVPAIVRNSHQRLVSHISVDARLQIDILRLAGEHPSDVVLTLLRCAPTCDRAQGSAAFRAHGPAQPVQPRTLGPLCFLSLLPVLPRCPSGHRGSVTWAPRGAQGVVLALIPQSCCNHVENNRLLESHIGKGAASAAARDGELASAQHVHLGWGGHTCFCPGCEFLGLAFTHPTGCLSSSSPSSPSLRRWPETWARGRLRGHQAHCSPCLGPWALPHGHLLGTERCLGLNTAFTKGSRGPCPPVLPMPSVTRALLCTQALLCRLRCDHVLVAMERERGWETMICGLTQAYDPLLPTAPGICALCPGAPHRPCGHGPEGLETGKAWESKVPGRGRLTKRPHPLQRCWGKTRRLEEPCFHLPFLTFLVEVSLLASAALLSCLPALWLLIARAAWDGVHAVCCCLVPALCGSGLLPAGSPVTALCLSAASPGPPRPRGAHQGSLDGEKGQRLKLRWAKQPIGLAGLQELGQLLPALLPHLPQCFGTGLRPVGPAAAGLACSARALLAVQPSTASQPSPVFRTGQKNLLGDRNGEVVSMTLSALLPLFDHVRLCAPSHGHWLLPRNFVDVQAFAQVGLGKLLLSLDLFSKVMDLGVNKGKKPLKRIVLSDVAASLEGAPAFCSWPCQRHKSPLLWAVADLHVSPALQASQGEDVEDGQMPGKEGREAAASGWRRPLSAVLSVRAGSCLRALLQAPAGPSLAQMEPRPGGAAGRQRGSPGSSRASAPSRARRQRLLAGPQGCAGRGGRGGAQGEPGPGAEPAPTLPSCRSLQLAEDSSRAAEYLRRALPYLESPQEPLHQPGLPPCPTAARPQPRLLPRQRHPGPAPLAAPCRARRACGPWAGSAAGRELLCVPRDGRALPEGTASRALPSHSGGGWPGELQCRAGSCDPCPGCSELRSLVQRDFRNRSGSLGKYIPADSSVSYSLRGGTLPIPIFTLHNSSLLIALSHQPSDPAHSLILPPSSSLSAQILGPGTHRPLLRFSSVPSSAHAHRGRRADEAGKVPVLKVHFHNTGFHGKLPRRAKELGMLEVFKKSFLKAQQCPIPAQDQGEGRSNDHLGLTGSFGSSAVPETGRRDPASARSAARQCRDAGRGSGEMPLEARGLLLKEMEQVQVCPFGSLCSFQSLRPAGLGRGAREGRSPLGKVLGSGFVQGIWRGG
ncbi:hypothetical protein DV515_00017465 [Chloebia gouldiae]|uniref:Uncharacterized protein n=1 Tax=Chloebia gouldiae TaxID=44316 RepID=A0A3L8QAY4_CHLGU|nr:hypothetical protein DV515_00017465 [Chloebia gouldiae]